MRKPDRVTKPVLSVAGLDPSGGAGLIADMRVFNLLGLYGAGVLTAVTAQNSRGVARVSPIGADIIEAQLDELLTELTPVASKTGMLATVGAARAVAARAASGSFGHLVVDPVLVSTSGDSLAEPGLVEALRQELLPNCRLVTPNVAEAEILSGIKIRTFEDAASAARELAQTGAGGVCITGGHLPGEPVDIVFEEGEIEYLGGKRLFEGEHIHGSGCFFSAAAVAYLAEGSTVIEAVTEAKALTLSAISSHFKPGTGVAVPWIHRTGV